jgi:eukaryotic-like serine/threonine-protein kinase
VSEGQRLADILNEKYRLVRQIGSGGMATVFEAEDTRFTNKKRLVAIKVLHPHYSADESFVTRFQREAESLIDLEHPGIVRMHEYDHDGDRYFIVMEFVKGHSVKELVRDGPLPFDRTIDIGVQMAKALEYAHQRGVIHRDVKSHNILVSEEGEAKLVDFGIAVAKGAASVTEAGTVLGTVHYIAPEQARGEPAIPASDIYSLGVVLYEMATGQLPFEGESAMEIATKHVSELPRPPSALNPKLPSNLERAIMHALEKDAANRPADAGELARELLVAPDDVTAQNTRVVEHPTEMVRQARAADESPRPAPRVAERPRPARQVVVEEPTSASWPIYLLAAVAALLVLGLIPLWSAVLRGG